MLWIELKPSYAGGEETLEANVYEDDQTTLATHELTNVLQWQAITRVGTTVDEAQCQATDCCREPRAPIGYYLTGNEDRTVLDGFFVTTDGKALCEDCGIEVLERQQVVIAG